MGRPREFDISIASQDAMNLFWHRGYKGTSLPDLLEGIGLSRGSLYKAFGSKRALFIEALSRYDEIELKPAIGTLRVQSSHTGALRIKRFFEGAIDYVAQGDRRGCLLCNAAVGAAANDPEIAKIINHMFEDLTAGFMVALRDCDPFKGVNDNELRARADGLTMSYVGLRVLARGGSPISKLKQAAAASLQDLA
ncbi:MAG: helix-turn-helix domain-containing protein [Pseudomonadota bacterium]